MKTEKAIMESKLDNLLSKRQISIGDTIAKIQHDGELLNDYVPYFKQLKFGLNDAGKIKVAGFNGDNNEFSRYAFGQMSERLGIPSRYMNILNDEGKLWQRELAVFNLNTHAENVKNEKVLVRLVDEKIRGVLSERYRRLNTALIFQAYLMAAMNKEAVLVDAYSNDDIDFIEVVSPELVHVPLKNAPSLWQIFGARLRNSNFGKSALQLQTFTINLRCTNGMVGENMIREVHLGARIPDNIRISESTVRKDTEAIAAIVTDTVDTIYDPSNVENQVKLLQAADLIEIEIPKEIEQLPKMGISSGEITELEAILMNGKAEDGVEGKPTLLKLAQGMTAVARNRSEKDGERGRELEDIASKMLLKRAK